MADPVHLVGAFRSAKQDAEGEARIVFVVPASHLAAVARLVLDYRGQALPSCGMEHELEQSVLDIESQVTLEALCKRDHADAYLALLAKLRDREALRSYFWLCEHGTDCSECNEKWHVLDRLPRYLGIEH